MDGGTTCNNLRDKAVLSEAVDLPFKGHVQQLPPPKEGSGEQQAKGSQWALSA